MMDLNKHLGSGSIGAAAGTLFTLYGEHFNMIPFGMSTEQQVLLAAAVATVATAVVNVIKPWLVKGDTHIQIEAEVLDRWDKAFQVISAGEALVESFDKGYDESTVTSRRKTYVQKMEDMSK